MSTKAETVALFHAVGTNRARAIDWQIWRAAEPGCRIVVATLDGVLDAIVLEGPRENEDGSETMPVEVAGRRRRLRMYRSASAGYWDRHPEERRYPGCDRDVELDDGLSARLCELRPRAPEQLGLFAGAAR